MRENYRMFARYNAWANERLYAATAGLSDEDYRRDCGAFFKSVHATLNHLLVADRVWMQRFTGTGERPKALDEILHDEFEPLKVARVAEDMRIAAYADTLTDAVLAAPFTYTPLTTPTPVTQPLWPALSHFFNHQAHHRGQIHALLTRLAGDAPSLDLVLFQRASGMGMT